jgi:hypothetical protein
MLLGSLLPLQQSRLFLPEAVVVAVALLLPKLEPLRESMQQ